MVKGPLGRELIFASDNRTIIVLVGIDGPEPPNDVLIATEDVINTSINEALISRGAEISVSRQTVDLTTTDNPSRQQMNKLGQNTLHVQQYDVETELEEVSMVLVNATLNTIVDELSDLDYNITGTDATVV